MSSPRGVKKTAIGTVTSDKMNKTRRVEVQRLVKHEQYGKYVRRRTICHAHDENNESHIGDTVEIMETRPLSKTKTWRIMRVIAKGEAPVEAVGMGEEKIVALK
jgi:small subunit ribosomal protein S17